MLQTKNLLVISLLILMLPVVALGQQASSSLLGVVTDRNGASVRGAEVRLTDTKTSKQRLAKTNEQGIYAFHRVEPGTGYVLTFTAQGFDTLVIMNVTLGVGLTETQHAELPVGQANNRTEVTANVGGTLNTTDASIGNVIDPRRLNQLPIQNRETPTALLGLQPGVVGNNMGVDTSLQGGLRGQNTLGSVTGSRADQTNITIDGNDVNDQVLGQPFTTVGNAPIDAIQEFRTISALPTAGEGRNAGGQILLVTKSGTNEFHGNLREYNRTSATAANTFFNNRTIDPTTATGQSLAKPQLTRNQFGGNIGGPINLPGYSGKDKAFFFFDYEGNRLAQGFPYIRIVPTDSFRAGNLSYVNAAGGITTLSAAQIAAIDPAGIGGNQALLGLINSRYPRVNDPTLGDGINTGGFRFNAPSNRSGNTYTTRLDLNATDRQKLFGRFNLVRTTGTDVLNNVAQQFPQDPINSQQFVVRDFSVVGGHTYAISSNIANQVTVGLTRASNRFQYPFAPTSPNLFGSVTPGDPLGGTFGNFITAPFPNILGQNRYVPVPTVRDDLNWRVGSHDMAFGASFKQVRQGTGFTRDFNSPDLGLGLLPTTGLQPADISANPAAQLNYDTAISFLLGRYSQAVTTYYYDANGNAFPLGTGQARDYRYNEFEAYAQDSWRLRQDLTLTYGVRYQYYPAPYETNGFQSGANVNFQNLAAIRQANALAGINGAAADPLLSFALIGDANNGRAIYSPDRNNFAPRLNLAYNPSFGNGLLGKVFGERKTVIRAGGAMIYDRPNGALTFLQNQSTFLFDTATTTLFPVTGNPADAFNPALNPRFAGTNVGVPTIAPPAITPTPGLDANGNPIGNGNQLIGFTVDPGLKTPYSIQYSVGFQRELPRNFILEMNYFGRQARNLLGTLDGAQILDFRDPASGQMMLTAFNGLAAQLNAGGAITPQPWFENQINGALAPQGLNCITLGAAVGVTVPNCTTFLALQAGPLVQTGNTAPIISALYGSGLLAPNSGMSSQFIANGYVTNTGSSSYNGMLFSLRKRLTGGLQFDFNYTLSHSVDNQSTITNSLNQPGGVMCDFRNYRACRGSSDFDVRHLINVNGIYELPFGRGRKFGSNSRGVVNTLLGGWQVGGIFTYRSGLPFNATTGAFPVSIGSESAALLNSGDLSALQQQINDAPDGSIQFFGNQGTALTALSFPLNGSSAGNRNVLRGQSFWNVDTTVLKNFSLPWSETQRIQFRWDSFNAFNNNSFALPLTSIQMLQFGQIVNSVGSPREMQFALRFEF
jgi:hypothetical protein